MMSTITAATMNIASTRVKRESFTPLGTHYYTKALLWQRIKIETEIEAELGLSKRIIRNYMVSTPAWRMPENVRAIFLRTLPEAAIYFVANSQLS